jgi:hypothetical protein
LAIKNNTGGSRTLSQNQCKQHQREVMASSRQGLQVERGEGGDVGSTIEEDVVEDGRGRPGARRRR